MSESNLVAVSPFFIVKHLDTSIAYYVDRLGFTLDFKGPADDPYYAGLTRESANFMLKEITPEILPVPNHTRHGWARWDAYVYTLDPDTLFEEFTKRGATFTKPLGYIDDGLWGFEVSDADSYIIAFFKLRKE